MRSWLELLFVKFIRMRSKYVVITRMVYSPIKKCLDSMSTQYLKNEFHYATFFKLYLCIYLSLLSKFDLMKGQQESIWSHL